MPEYLDDNGNPITPLTQRAGGVYLDDDGNPIEPEPDDYWSGFRKSAGDTAMRTIRGVKRGAIAAINPINIATGLYDTGKDVLTNRGRDTREGLSEMASAVASGDPDVGGEVIGGLLTGGLASRFVPRMIKRGAPIAADITRAAGKTAVSREFPITGTALKEWDKVRTGRAMREVDAPVNVAKARQNVFDASKGKNTALGSDDIADVLAQLGAEDLPASVGGSKTLRAGQNLPVVNPQRTSGMVSTQPDKWGATSIHQAEDFVDRSRLVDRARPVQKAALSDDAFTRNVTGDPQRQQLVRELLRAESPEDLGGRLTQSGRSMLDEEEQSMFANALRELRSGSLNRAQSIRPPLR